MNPKVSIFASAIRARLWDSFFKSLESTSVPYEVCFAGPLRLVEVQEEFPRTSWPENFKYERTENIKPAQAYEVARRLCTGELMQWSADDVEYSEDCLGKAYKYWEALGANKLVALSIQSIEDDHKFDMNDHSFVGFDRSTPLMAPVALISREFVEESGGFDRRFVAGQYENNCIMQLYEAGGGVIIFREGHVVIDHLKKHGKDHLFRAGFTKDRQVLEKIWGKRGELLRTGKSLKHEPYSDKDILTHSQCLEDNSLWI